MESNDPVTKQQMQMENMRQKQQAQEEADEKRSLVLSSILSTEAKERISRISLVKPDKARKLEDLILQAAMSGRIQGKVSEPMLLSMLEQVGGMEQAKTTSITFNRKRFDDDDFSDDDLDGL
mmetsp:Transcript_3217/g.3486  ORF Transcript_3217/g.3486 Transcript_3217/m.3486 type:complete len:122 (-) Transcript_3217:48-413(-)